MSLGPSIRRRRRFLLLALFIITIGTTAIMMLYPYLVIDLGYLTRPLWDKPNALFKKIIIHNYAPGMDMQKRCEAHGWTKLETPKKVYDAVIFSVELDMMEIRIRELWDVVDHFVILEANATFTGLPKELVFEKHRSRFAFADSKILYKAIPLYPLQDGESPWVNEGRMRDGVTAFLGEVNIQKGDLFTVSDVDEIIAHYTIDLLKSCAGTPESIHVQLSNYLYSYEFVVHDEGQWRPSVHSWNPGTSYYGHGQHSEILLTDAGWHCSFCFRSIEEFRFKMLAYSHADRVRYNYMMEPKWIQKAICEGSDLFGMFPEAYSFQELISRLGKLPKTDTAVHLPRHVLENRDTFKFLLPGGCIR